MQLQSFEFDQKETHLQLKIGYKKDTTFQEKQIAESSKILV